MAKKTLFLSLLLILFCEVKSYVLLPAVFRQMRSIRQILRATQAASIPAFPTNETELTQAKFQQIERVRQSLNEIEVCKDNYLQQHIVNVTKSTGYGLLGVLGACLFSESLEAKLSCISMGMVYGWGTWKNCYQDIKLREKEELKVEQAISNMRAGFNQIESGNSTSPHLVNAYWSHARQCNSELVALLEAKKIRPIS